MIQYLVKGDQVYWFCLADDELHAVCLAVQRWRDLGATEEQIGPTVRVWELSGEGDVFATPERTR
jgi:hypothetical protein